MFCTKCGSEITGIASYCSNCGTAIVAVTNAPAAQAETPAAVSIVKAHDQGASSTVWAIRFGWASFLSTLLITGTIQGQSLYKYSIFLWQLFAFVMLISYSRKPSTFSAKIFIAGLCIIALLSLDSLIKAIKTEFSDLLAALTVFVSSGVATTFFLLRQSAINYAASVTTAELSARKKPIWMILVTAVLIVVVWFLVTIGLGMFFERIVF